MSISTELERITEAKADLKDEMENRGLTVGDAKIDNYASLLASYPYVVKGTFTPEEDTKTFSISTPFEPAFVAIISDVLLATISLGAYVDEAIPVLTVQKGKRGFALRMTSTGAVTLSISSTSSTVTWGNTSFTFQLPTSTPACFKAGYTYDYYIAGGFAE